jgi:hypothetical protein
LLVEAAEVATVITAPIERRAKHASQIRDRPQKTAAASASARAERAPRWWQLAWLRSARAVHESEQMRIGIPMMVAVAACYGGSGDSHEDLEMCTPEAREIAGTALTIESVGALDTGSSGTCPPGLIRSAVELAAAFPDGVPASLAGVDFAIDRVVLGQTNPAIVFVVDDGAALVVVEQSFCQGAAPRCSGVIVRDTTHDVLVAESCSYLEADLCDAP